MEMGIPKYLNYLNNHQHQIEIYSKQTVHIKINRGNSIQILHHARKRQLFLNKTKRKIDSGLNRISLLLRSQILKHWIPKTTAV